MVDRRCVENSLYKGWAQVQHWAPAALPKAVPQPGDSKHCAASGASRSASHGPEIQRDILSAFSLFCYCGGAPVPGPHRLRCITLRRGEAVWQRRSPTATCLLCVRRTSTCCKTCKPEQGQPCCLSTPGGWREGPWVFCRSLLWQRRWVGRKATRKNRLLCAERYRTVPAGAGGEPGWCRCAAV